MSPFYVIATYGASVKICVYIKTIVEATKVKLVWNNDLNEQNMQTQVETKSKKRGIPDLKKEKEMNIFHNYYLPMRP